MNYLFIANSSKPSNAASESAEPYSLSNFSKPCIESALSLGFDVYMGINRKHPEEISCDYPIQFYNMEIYRNPFQIREVVRACKNAMRLLKREKFEAIHCNTPIGGFIGRVCGRKAGVPKVIYTAHGFHFYKGAPLLNWIVYYPLERWLAHDTDALITINKEDYERAKTFRLRGGGNVYYVPGVGIDPRGIVPRQTDRIKTRAALGLSDADVICIAMGDLTKNKNYAASIQAVAKCGMSSVHLLICGRGPEETRLKNLTSQLHAADRVHFLGFRTDIPELLGAADIFVFSSFREGLSRSLMEAMAQGLPCVVSSIRGNTDLIEDEVNGFLCGPKDADAFARAIDRLADDRPLRQEMGAVNLERIQEYSIQRVTQMMQSIYKKTFMPEFEKKKAAGKRVVLLRSNPVSPDPPVEKAAGALAALGYSVVIVAWDREQAYDFKTETIPLKEGNVEIIRFGIPAVYGGGLKKNLFPLLSFQKRLGKWLKRHKNQYDIIHAFDFDTGYTACKLAKRFQKKFVYHILDFYIDSHNLRNRIGSVIKKREFSVINSADGVIICTEKRAEQIQGAHPRNLAVIHNTPKQTAFGGPNDLVIQGREGTCKIVYVGILANTRFIEEIAGFVGKDHRFEFHIGGFGSLEARVRDLAAAYGNVFFYGKLPYAQALALESACDMMTAIYDPSVPNHRYAAPNKFYESLMLGKPVLMARNTGFDDVIEKNQIGRLIDYSPEGLADGILGLYESKEDWKAMSERAKALYHEAYSWSIMEPRMKELYEKI